MKWTRIAVFCVTTFFTCFVSAQAFPTKPIRIIVPSGPGGNPDLVTRLLGPLLSASLGQPVVVENMGGAGGVIGVQSLIKAAPDGYTLAANDTGKWSILPALQPKLYDPVKDMTPVAQVTTNSVFIYVGDSFPAKNLQELIAAVKGKPGAYFYGSSGNGTHNHLTMEAFKSAYGLSITHVPYAGSPESIRGALAGEVQMVMTGLTAGAPHVKAGKMRLIATTTKRRSKFAPDVPSMSEAGAADFDFRGDVAYFVPAGTPKPVIDRLASSIGKILQQSEVV
ncbi:MAG: tripartite tricarboxylate transporter substrate binding protein, partial [Fimbriimonadaceae bacterium]